jgi:hypothetical protein
VRVLYDHHGQAIRLTDERLGHLLEHPEMAGLESAIGEALAEPDRVVQSLADAQVRLYYRWLSGTSVGDKHLCVVVKYLADDAFVVTAYLTDSIKKGTRLWPNAK